MRARSAASSLPLAAVVVALVLVAAGFVYYYAGASQSLSRLGSDDSSLSSAASAESVAISFQESSISCLHEEVSLLSSELNATSEGTAPNGTSFTCTAEAPGLSLVNFSATLAVESGVGTGELTVSIWNGGSMPIVGASVNVSSAGLGSPSGPPVFLLGGNPMSEANPLGHGETASATAEVVSGTTGLFLGYDYLFRVSVAFVNGAVESTGLNARAVA